MKFQDGNTLEKARHYKQDVLEPFTQSMTNPNKGNTTK